MLHDNGFASHLRQKRSRASIMNNYTQNCIIRKCLGPRTIVSQARLSLRGESPRETESGPQNYALTCIVDNTVVHA